MPSTRPEYWREKLCGNAARDRNVQQQLRKQGWKVLTVWECELRDEKLVTQRCRRVLNSWMCRIIR